MERDIDVYDSIHNRRRPLKFSNNPVIWKKIWKSCCSFLGAYSYMEIYSFHHLIRLWMPIINAHMNYPIPSLEQYDTYFYYLNEASESKEILYLLIDPHTRGRKTLHMIFNIPLFRKITSLLFRINQSQNNFLMDADRGTVSLTLHASINPSDFFKRSATWFFLFLVTCHALAHLDCYNKYDTASYDKHDFLKKSVFYHVFIVGGLKYTFL